MVIPPTHGRSVPRPSRAAELSAGPLPGIVRPLLLTLALLAACRETVDDPFSPGTGLHPGTADIQVGHTVQLSVSGATGAIDWSSNDVTVASVEFGLVSGEGAGMAVITAIADRDTLFATVNVTDPPTANLSLATDVQPIFNARCIGCHGATSPSGGLSLTAAQSYAELVNQPSGSRVGVILVIPGDSVNSYLYQAVNRVPASSSAWMPPNCGSAQNPCLTADVVEIIGAWIQQGANP